MKTRITLFILIPCVGILVLFFSGCYTQLGMTREERRQESEQYSSQGNGNDTNMYRGNDSEEYYDRGQSSYYNDYYDAYPHNRFGFSYYYPSTYWPSYAFSVAYMNPWSYDYYSGYDPWWCGTPYAGYPVYGRGYYPYAYYPAAYYSYGHAYAVNPVRTQRRDFGSTRGITTPAPSVNTNYSSPPVDRSSAFPNMDRLDASSRGTSRNNTPSVNSTPRTNTPPTGTSTGNRVNSAGSRSPRGTSVRGGRGRAPSGRDTVPQSRPNERSGQASPPQQKQHGERNDRGYSRSSSPRFMPPVAPSSPPPSRSGGAQPSGGSRGGSTRGGRP